MKRVIFDFDDTINDMLPRWVALLNERYNLSVKVDNITDWDMSKAYPSLTHDQIYEPLRDPSYWQSVPCPESVVHNIELLRDHGFEVLLATSTHPSDVSVKYRHCIKYFPFDRREIIFTYRKDILECDYIVDDYPPNLADNKGVRILIDAPYNQKGGTTNYAGMYDFRAADMTEAVKIILAHEGVKV